MSDDTFKLWKQVRNNSSEDLVVRFVSSAIGDAVKIGVETLVERGDNVQTRLSRPQTVGEILADRIGQTLLAQDWIDPEKSQVHAILDEMASVCAQLDMGVDKPWAWDSLFRMNDELREKLEKR